MTIEIPFRPEAKKNPLVIEGAETVKATLEIANSSKNRKKDLRFIDLSYQDLIEIDLHEGSLSYANFYKAKLDRANLHNAYLNNADFNNAHLHGTFLTSAELANADFTDANLHETKLKWADLTKANLTNANLTNADLTNAILIGTNLFKADFAGAKLDQVLVDKDNAYALIRRMAEGKCPVLKSIRVGDDPDNYETWDAARLDMEIKRERQKSGLIPGALAQAVTGGQGPSTTVRAPDLPVTSFPDTPEFHI
ncbi:MAG: pentapeptide repeat-containing protein [Pseudomonadota bacterium]|nr:pentapeptide repeat-containing protein [Pseudomonadota bacterium]